jgi:hypothetical protein
MATKRHHSNDERAKEGAGSPWPDELREEVGEFYMRSYHVDNLVLVVLPELQLPES